MIRQQRVLNEVSTALEAGGDKSKSYLDQLNQLRDEITKPENLSLLVAANFDAIENADEPWKNFLPSKLEPSSKPFVFNNWSIKSGWNLLNRLHVTADCELISGCASDRGCIVGLGCVESSFLKHCCPGLQGYKHEDLPALMVFAQYLTQLEVKNL
jgi:Zn-dependent M16 (insulinase) family peptidase